jgi:hypothetical protein
LFHADRRTYMTKLIVVFRNIVNAPTKETVTSRQSSNWHRFIHGGKSIHGR